MSRLSEIIASLATFVLCAVPAVAQNDYGSLLPRLEQAVQAFEAGKSNEAVVQLELILKARPSASTAQRLRDYLITGAGSSKRSQMMSAPGELSLLLRYILSRSESVKFTPITSAQKIQDLVSRFVEGDPVEKYRALISIQAKIGARATPYFLAYLTQTESVANRTSAIIGLQKLGPVAVVPLLQALASSDSIQVQNCLFVLGNIGDFRAAGAMRTIVDDPSYPNTVRTAARKAIVKLTGIGPDPLARSASDYYLETARGYYEDDPEAMSDLGIDTLFWQWESGKLVGQKIPPFLINEMLAEEACLGALRTSPNNKQAWDLLLLTYLAQYTEVSDLAIAAQEKKAQLSADEETMLKRVNRLMWRIRAVAAIGGPEALGSALTKAMADRRGRLAEVAARILGQVIPRGTAPPASLTRALSYGDRRVQYAAALALVRISPTQAFDEARLVVSILGRALGEKAPRLVLVVSDKPALRKKISRAIREAGHLAAQSFNGPAALDIARRWPLFDLIVVDTNMAGMAGYQIYETLRQDLRTQNIPFVAVLKPSDPPQRKSVYGNAVVGSTALAAAVSSVAASKGDNAGRFRRLAAQAAAALAGVHPRHPVFDVSAATPSLIKALSRSDAVRAPATRALASHGTPAALPVLAATFNNKAVSTLTRLAAARAIGSISARHPGSDKGLVSTIANGLADDDPRIREAAGSALGLAGLTDANRLSTVRKYALAPASKGALK